MARAAEIRSCQFAALHYFRSTWTQKQLVKPLKSYRTVQANERYAQENRTRWRSFGCNRIRRCIQATIPDWRRIRSTRSWCSAGRAEWFLRSPGASWPQGWPLRWIRGIRRSQSPSASDWSASAFRPQLWPVPVATADHPPMPPNVYYLHIVILLGDGLFLHWRKSFRT